MTCQYDVYIDFRLSNANQIIYINTMQIDENNNVA